MKKNRISLLMMLIFAFSLLSTNAFALPDDSVLSQTIKEADGTTGQDTNTGSGIKTGHIQDEAITPAKIGFYRNVVVVAPSGESTLYTFGMSSPIWSQYITLYSQ